MSYTLTALVYWMFLAICYMVSNRRLRKQNAVLVSDLFAAREETACVIDENKKLKDIINGLPDPSEIFSVPSGEMLTCPKGTDPVHWTHLSAGTDGNENAE